MRKSNQRGSRTGKGKRRDLGLHANESMAAGLKRIADALTEGALERIKCPGENPEKDIHALRTTIKRLRAMLQLIRPALVQETFERENTRLREAAQRLAYSRDSTVLPETLRTVCKEAAGDEDREAFALALHRLKGIVGKPPEVDLAKALRDVKVAFEQSQESFSQLAAEGAEPETIRRGLEQIYRGARKRMKRALKSDHESDFHRWRIRVKNLYHLLQWFAPLCPKALCEMVEILDKLQDKIGQDHDLAVVSSWLRKGPNLPEESEALECVLGYVDDYSKKLRQKIRPLGKALFADKPGQFCKRLEVGALNPI